MSISCQQKGAPGALPGCRSDQDAGTAKDRGDPVGDARVEWDGRGVDGRRLPNGVYFLRLEGEDFVASEKVTLLR